MFHRSSYSALSAHSIVFVDVSGGNQPLHQGCESILSKETIFGLHGYRMG